MPNDPVRDELAFCSGGPFPSRIESEIGSSVTIGPLLFTGLRFPQPASRFAPGSPPLSALVVVPPRTRAVISVPTGMRSVIGLASGASVADRPRDAALGLVCVAGPSQRIYSIAFVVSGPRCVPVTVSARGRADTRVIRFGTRRCNG